jgi:DNA-binding PadR family transcriptional regulator
MNPKEGRMSQEAERELTTLEYIVLGLTAQEPQSGYSIITAFASNLYRWSASPGSVYPMLKRLEHQGLLISELEAVHETRPRKMYRPTSLGLETLDEWLRRPLTKREVSIERDVMLLKFFFMENRLSRPEIFTWLDAYEQDTNHYAIMLTTSPTTHPEAAGYSLHYQLIVEAGLIEIDMQRAWIQVARRRLQAMPRNQ